MPMLFSISGHSASVGNCKDYLEQGPKSERSGIAGYVEKDGRAAAKAFIGIERADQWGCEMDEMRRVFGQNKGVTFRHFVLSPDPRDKASAKDVAAYAREWTIDRFGENVHAAIIVHTDTDNPHAHVVLNNIDTSTGKKIHISNKERDMLAVRAQQIGVSYGYRPLPDVREAGKRERTAQERGRGIEWRIEAKGYISWKADIRRASEAALAKNPRSFAEYREALRGYGCDVRTTRRGGYTYRAAEGARCKGARLGLKFEPVALIPMFKDNAEASTRDLSISERMAEAKRQVELNEAKNGLYWSAQDMERRARGVEALIRQGTASSAVLENRLGGVKQELAANSRAVLEKVEDLKSIDAALAERASYESLQAKLGAAAELIGEIPREQREELKENLKPDVERFRVMTEAYEGRPDLSEENLVVLKDKTELEIAVMESKNIDLLDRQSDLEAALEELNEQEGDKLAAGDYEAPVVLAETQRAEGLADRLAEAWSGSRDARMADLKERGLTVADMVRENIKRERDAVHVDNVQEVEQGGIDSLEAELESERER